MCEILTSTHLVGILHLHDAPGFLFYQNTKDKRREATEN